MTCNDKEKEVPVPEGVASLSGGCDVSPGVKGHTAVCAGLLCPPAGAAGRGGGGLCGKNNPGVHSGVCYSVVCETVAGHNRSIGGPSITPATECCDNNKRLKV